MTSFSYICIVWLTFCVGLLSLEPEITVPGQVGSTAVLPCKLQRVGTETPHIRWRIKSEDVFERFGEESYQGEGYEGRVDVPEEELRKGNCSLVLRNLTVTDAGVYTSYQIVKLTKSSASGMTKREEISRVNLSVQEKPKERKQEPSTSSTLSGK
ncbi:CD276 antigen homolog [Pangasianodon hypophthalmus]|uniref:CD276 antigen homolog n=1 Tax=Pangasianodon hypophthalmus TaxID=310915 RepID=UPI002306E275|nr:CD276 antigen homolog [Pangasianodon hypophthalmus]